MKEILVTKISKIETSKDGHEFGQISQCPIRRALKILIRELGVTQGSFKVYVRDGQPSQTIEVQKELSVEF